MAKMAFTNNDSCVDHVPDWTVDKIRVENKNCFLGSFLITSIQQVRFLGGCKLFFSLALSHVVSLRLVSKYPTTNHDFEIRSTSEMFIA